VTNQLDEEQTEQQPDNTGFAFIGAIHGLLSSERAATKADLLLAAILQVISEADRGLDAIKRRVAEIWPGSNPSRSDIEAALQLGVDLRLLAETGGLDGKPSWTLTKQGYLDVQQHHGWVEGIRNRCIADIQERALTGLQIELDRDRAELWLEQLVRALASGIQSSQDPYLGKVDALIKGTMLPRSFDRERILSHFEDAPIDPAAAEFLRALTLAVLDPLDPFGNELVTQITTGCVLHAHVAGMDRAAILKKVGRPEGERIIIDTPILLDLLGPKRISAALRVAIQEAVAADWEVIALEHSIEEAQEVLDRELPNLEEALIRAHKDGLRREWYASLSDDKLPSLCIEALNDGTYNSLQQIKDAGDRLTETLTGLGVVVRPHGNGDDPRVQRLHDGLVEVLKGSKLRSPHVIQRDADSMAVAWRRRRRQSGRWPGAWILTKDRHMATAFTDVTHDRVRVTINLGQWASILSATAPTPNVARLASVAASQVIDEAIWYLPARFPAEVAYELAKQLSPEHGGSDTDVRLAQLTLDDALEREENPAALASQVLSARQLRLNQIMETERVRMTTEAAGYRSRADTAENRALAAQAARLEAESDVATLRQTTDGLNSDLTDANTRFARLLKSAAVCAIALVLAVVACFLGHPATIVSSIVGLVVVAGACWHWVTHPRRNTSAFIAALVLEVLGGVSAAFDLIDKATG
jgi:hypothetical protein